MPFLRIVKYVYILYVLNIFVKQAERIIDMNILCGKECNLNSMIKETHSFPDIQTQQLVYMH
jgi:hypothetical protein